jgi:hypothetical protein
VNANRGINLRIVIDAAVKDVEPYGIFLQASRLLTQSLLDKIPEKASQTFRAGKGCARKYFFEMLLNGLYRHGRHQRRHLRIV